MSNINKWLKIIIDNEIHAYNKVNSRDLSVCINFIQIPDTLSVVMTLAIMKNRIKKNSLDPKGFAKLMGIIESNLDEAHHSFSGVEEPEYFENVKDKLKSQWYISLCCHRVFFIPESGLFLTLEQLFKQENIRQIKSCGIEEISIQVNTEGYDFNAKVY